MDFIKNHENFQAALDAQVSAYQHVAIEHDKIKQKANNLENICTSWCISSLMNEDYLSKQIPSQVKAVLREDFDLKIHQEAESKLKEFVPDTLPNTFSYTIGTKKILTNAFVKPEKY